MENGHVQTEKVTKKMAKNRIFEHSTRRNRTKNENFQNSRITFGEDHEMNTLAKFHKNWPGRFPDFHAFM